MELLGPYSFQGYEVYVDNFYTSPKLFDSLLELGIAATGTFRTNRRGIPKDVLVLKNVLNVHSVTRGTGYYIREKESNIVYTCWRDTRVVLVMSTAYPGHTNTKVKRKIRKDGKVSIVEIPQPEPVTKYNQFMGGVDKSDQFLSYHNILRRTVRYWKTLFYHMIDIAVVNSFILYNNIALISDCRTVTENDFRDQLVLQLISKYGRVQQKVAQVGRPRLQCRIHHGSTIVSKKNRCQYCRIKGKCYFSQRKCLDCEGQPTLCQTRERDCHALWHAPEFDSARELWTISKKTKATTTADSTVGSSFHGRPSLRNQKKYLSQSF